MPGEPCGSLISGTWPLSQKAKRGCTFEAYTTREFGTMIAVGPPVTRRVARAGRVARGRVRILSLTSGDPLEAIGGREDGDTLVVAKRVQIGIARDDRLCSCGERARKNVGVIGVAQFRGGNFRRRDECCELGVAGKQEGGSKTGSPELRGEFLAREHIFQFSDERAAGEEFDALRFDRVKEAARHAAPEESRHDDVRVDDDAHRGLLAGARAALGARRVDLSLNLYLGHRRELECLDLIERGE